MKKKILVVFIALIFWSLYKIISRDNFIYIKSPYSKYVVNGVPLVYKKNVVGKVSDIYRLKPYCVYKFTIYKSQDIPRNSRFVCRTSGGHYVDLLTYADTGFYQNKDTVATIQNFDILYDTNLSDSLRIILAQYIIQKQGDSIQNSTDSIIVQKNTEKQLELINKALKGLVKDSLY